MGAITELASIMITQAHHYQDNHLQQLPGAPKIGSWSIY